MKKNLIYWGIIFILYVLYFQVVRIIWDNFIPWNPLTDWIALFVLTIVNIPLSIITTEKIFKIIKNT